MPCRLPNPPLDKYNLHVTKASELLSRIFNMLHEILHLWIINYCLFPQSNLQVFMNLTCNIQLSNNFSFDSGMTCMHGFHGFKVCMLQNFFQDTWIECIYIYICICVWVCIKLQFWAFYDIIFFIRLHTTAKAVSEAEYSSYGATKQGGQVSQV